MLRSQEIAGEFIDFPARELNPDLRDVRLLLTWQNDHGPEDLQGLARLVFEDRQSPALFFVRKGVSVLSANGKTNGIRLESGH